MPRPKSWSPQKIAYWKRRYAAGGILHREIAERTGTNVSTVAWYLGGTRKPPRLNADQVAEIRRLYATVEGITQADLGKRFGVVASWIGRAVRGVEPVPRWLPCDACADDRCEIHKPPAGAWGTPTRKVYPHGSRARYFIQRCRCQACHDANIEYERRRRRLRVYGQFDEYVDARPAQMHLRRLAEAGIGYKSVARACGVTASTLARVLGTRGKQGARYGKGRWREAGYRPIRRLRRSTVEKILATTLSDARPPGGLVSKADTQIAFRRIADLVAAGMKKYEIAVYLDPKLKRFVHYGKRPGLQITRGRQQITRKNFEAIAELYVSFFRERRMATPEEQRRAALEPEAEAQRRRRARVREEVAA